MLKDGILADGVRWIIGEHPRKAIPLCPKDFMKLHTYPDVFSDDLKCEECGNVFSFPRSYDDEKDHILNKIDAKLFKKMRFINLDDEAIPIAEDKATSKDDKYFVKAVLTESKTGKRLIVYAGKKGEKEKTQIFVEPEIRRLAFDQNDLHPTDVFTKLEATFSDDSKASQKKEKMIIHDRIPARQPKWCK